MNRSDHVLLIIFFAIFFCTLISRMSGWAIATTDVVSGIVLLLIAEWSDRRINQERGS